MNSDLFVWSLIRQIIDFIASTGWLYRWQQRFNIKFKIGHGESGSADVESADRFRETEIPRLMATYSPKDVYNMDETGLLYRETPRGGLARSSDKVVGLKTSKERLTVALCTNMDGTDKRPLLIIGKSKRPNCFKGIKTLPTLYEANQNAWMTSDIFKAWLTKFDDRMTKSNRKIALVMDNATSHNTNLRLKSVEIVRIPPNTTSHIQPLDMGVIRSFKCKYRTQMANKAFDELDAYTEVSKVNVLQVQLNHYSLPNKKKVQ